MVPSSDGPNCTPLAWRRILTDRWLSRRTLLEDGDDAGRDTTRLLLVEREISALGADSEADVERDRSEATLATLGTFGSALIASDGIRIPGVTFGETGKSFNGLESLCVGTLRETARCNAPRDAIDPPRSRISWRDRFASAVVLFVCGRVGVVERDICAGDVELRDVDLRAVELLGCEDDCVVDGSEIERCKLLDV